MYENNIGSAAVVRRRIINGNHPIDIITERNIICQIEIA